MLREHSRRRSGFFQGHVTRGKTRHPTMPKSVGKRITVQADLNLEMDVLRLLGERKQTFAVAESCTGGCLAHWLTNVPGASAVFLGGVVAYSNTVKQKFLGVRAKTLAAQGAVSEAVAREMAEGARKKFGVDYALAVTGIAGPTGGTKAKPVGTVFMALAGASGTIVQHRLNPFERRRFKEVTVRQALTRLHSELLKSGTFSA